MDKLNKPCIKCGAVDRNPKSGNCRPCKNKRSKDDYAKNTEKYKNRVRPTLEKAREYSKKWRENNPDYKHPLNPIRKEVAYAWRRENAEKYKKYKKEWNAKNREKLALYQKKYASENRCKMSEKWRLNSLRRRALKIGSGGRLSSNIRKKLWDLQKGKCACCGVHLRAGVHLDHIMPLALGGQNIDANIQLLRPECNMQKNAKHPIDYMREKGLLL